MEDNNNQQLPGQGDELPKPEVQTPGDQPLQQQYTMDSTVGHVKKSKKKLVIVIVLLLLLLGGGAAAYYFFVLNKDDSQQAQSQVVESTDDQFVPTVMVQDGKEVYLLNESNELEKFFTLQDGDRVIEVVNEDNNPVVRYTNESTDNGTLNEYGEVINGERKTLVKFPADAQSWTGAVVSPDGSKVAVELNKNGTEFQEFAIYDTADQSKTTLYKQSDANEVAPLLFDWPEANTVIVQEIGCRNCGGGSLPKLSSINVETGVKSDFYNNPSSGITRATFNKSSYGNTMYLDGGPLGKDAPDFVEPETGTDVLLSIGLDKKEVKLVESSSVLNYLGESSDSTKVYYSQYTVDQEPDYTRSKPGFYEVVASGGNPTEIAIETQYIKEGTVLVSAVNYSDGVLILAYDQTADGTGLNYNLLKLPLNDSGDEFANLLESKSADYNSVEMFVVQ